MYKPDNLEEFFQQREGQLGRQRRSMGSQVPREK